MPDGKKNIHDNKGIKVTCSVCASHPKFKILLLRVAPTFTLICQCPCWHQLYFAFYSTFIWRAFFFSRQCLDFFRGVMVLCFPVSLIFRPSASLLLCFSAFLLHCFSVFGFPCFSAFPASQFFVFPASLLFLLLCFSASLFSPLLCFLASYFYFPCVFHFPSLDSILSVS